MWFRSFLIVVLFLTSTLSGCSSLQELMHKRIQKVQSAHTEKGPEYSSRGRPEHHNPSYDNDDDRMRRFSRECTKLVLELRKAIRNLEKRELELKKRIEDLEQKVIQPRDR